MLDWLKGFLWGIFKEVGGWFLDLLVWILEYLYGLISDLFDALLSFCTSLIVKALESLNPYIPSGLVNNVTVFYEWLEYVNDWIPISYGLELILAYFSITMVVTIFRKLWSCIPFIGG